MNYLHDPKAIYARSFEIIRAETDLSRLPPTARGIAVRVIHACGMTDIAGDLRITPDFAEAAKTALRAGRPIIVDSEMVRKGIIAKQLPKGVDIICTLNDPRVRDIGIARQTTRSAAAVELWAPYLGGAVVVIGNAPTALFALLEAIDAGAGKPAALVGFPVGFVGAMESKDELIRNPRGIAYATLPGRRGGSAMAAAVINALTEENA
jgi:precorrin-8X/cobalt-precorrin-8 methylmutase